MDGRSALKANYKSCINCTQGLNLDQCNQDNCEWTTLQDIIDSTVNLVDDLPLKLPLSPTDGQVLTYVLADGQWEAKTPGGGTGTVTSVGLSDGSTVAIYSITGSPVTSSGSLTFSLKTQTANTVFAGPTSGGAAQPGFRALVAADIPDISSTYLTKANNLSDVANAKTSRNNLGIYTVWMSNGDQTTTNATATNITDLVFAVGTSQVWSFDAFIHIGCNNTGGVKFAISIPTGATMFFNVFGNSTTAGTAFNGNSLTSSGTLTSLLYTTANSSLGFVYIRGTVTTDGTHSGNVQFQFASGTAGQTSTIFKEGTFIKITPLQ